MLPATDVHVGSGEVVLVTGAPGPAHPALALALAGRLHLDGGTVHLDGSPDRRQLQRAVLLVDTPSVTEPDGSSPVRTVVGEQLALARHRARRRDVAALLAAHGAERFARHRWEQVPPVLRTRLLVAAGTGPGTRFVVLTCPDRWGGAPEEWLALAAGIAAGRAAGPGPGPGVVLQGLDHLLDARAAADRPRAHRIGATGPVAP